MTEKEMETLRRKLDFNRYKPTDIDRCIAFDMTAKGKADKSLQDDYGYALYVMFLSGMAYGRTRFTDKELLVLEESYAELLTQIRGGGRAYGEA